jgi:hypothetical protein
MIYVDNRNDYVCQKSLPIITLYTVASTAAAGLTTGSGLPTRQCAPNTFLNTSFKKNLLTPRLPYGWEKSKGVKMFETTWASNPYYHKGGDS